MNEEVEDPDGDQALTQETPDAPDEVEDDEAVFPTSLPDPPITQ